MAVLSKVANIAVQPQPVGVVEAFAGINAPNGWLICDGSQVSRSLFPELFSVIGTTYGSGDGFTTFTLPDLRGRTIAGKDGVNNMNNGPTNRLTSSHFGSSGTALGNSGGSESNTLTTAQMPSHTHIQNSHNHSQNPHTHYIYSGPAGGVHPSIYQNGNNGPLYGPVQTVTATNNPTTATNQNTGGGGAHNNTQPTMILNYIIKAVSELPRGGWYNSSSPDLVTSLPTNPYEGQEVYLQQTVAGTNYQTAKRYSAGTWYDTGATPAGTWVNATYYNGWTSYGGSYSPARYMKDADGIVHVDGLVKSGTVGYGVAIIILPVGYRPAYQAIFSQTTNPDVSCRVDVFQNGTIASSNANNAWLSISGISFKAEA